MVRDIFLLPRPPLLAVMQGGEYRSPETHPLFVRAPTGTDSEFCNTLSKEGNRHFSTSSSNSFTASKRRVRAKIDPPPALRATFSRREKDSRNPLGAFSDAAATIP